MKHVNYNITKKTHAHTHMHKYQTQLSLNNKCFEK